MNKGELVDAVAEKASVTKKQADAVLSAALEAIMEAVSDGDKVTLVGFGSFESRERKAREGSQSQNWRQDGNPGNQSSCIFRREVV